MIEIYSKTNNDRLCDTCNHRDVCMYKNHISPEVETIKKMNKDSDELIQIDIRCTKWSAQDQITF
jgi:arsenate reductase-like glutaredoxin family protein